jgi:curved DNA-binding protein CbpA
VRTHYQVLDLEPSATPSELRARWRALRNLYEDDLGTYGLLSADERAASLHEIEAAWAVLGDAERRRAYDAELRAAGEAGPWYEPADDSGSWTGDAPVESVVPAERPQDESRGPVPAPAAAVRVAAESQPEPTPAPPELAAGERMHGAWMRQWRRHRGVSLETLSSELKITVTQLENIESHRFERLPAPVYLKGFLRNYARAVGLDGDRLVEDYLELRRIWEEGRA